jgi:transposase-like protein
MSDEQKLKLYEQRAGCLDEQSLKQIKEMYQNGFGIKAIGKKFGISFIAVQHRLEMQNVQIRDSREASNAVYKRLGVVSKRKNSVYSEVGLNIKNGQLRSKNLTNEEKEQIKQDYLNGESIKVIANKNKLGWNKVKKLLKEYNILRPRMDFVNDPLSMQIKELYLNKMSIEALGREFNVSADFIKWRLKKLKVQLRNKSEVELAKRGN